jgi:hypothetical protein
MENKKRGSLVSLKNLRFEAEFGLYHGLRALYFY